MVYDVIFEIRLQTGNSTIDGKNQSLYRIYLLVDAEQFKIKLYSSGDVLKWRTNLK